MKKIKVGTAKKAVKMALIGVLGLIALTLPRTVGAVFFNIVLYGLNPKIIGLVISGFQIFWLFYLVKQLKLIKALCRTIWESNFLDFMDEYWP